MIILVILLPSVKGAAQISPGDLASPHSQLEGISNCTQCHELGNKVNNSKCLACHTEIKDQISQEKGYHVSVEVKGKDCFVCHNDHHGKNFQLVRMDISTFDHNLTGYTLTGAHAKKECKDCHNVKFITSPKIKSKNFTYLGLNQKCLTCHSDYHQKTLSDNCLECHNQDAFVPATKFNHSDTRFKLVGKHKTVECLKCHKIQTSEGKKFQQFKLDKSLVCNSCHNDPHQNKFGLDCKQCHNEESFKIAAGQKAFDHNKTGYKLEDKHLTVNCKACHKGKFTDPLKHAKCTDCHSDYHKGQFVKNNISPDCSQCHNVKGFTFFSYSLDQHNLSSFPLKGSHNAIPCIDCHKKQKEWSFKGVGKVCSDCHKDIHKGIIDSKYYPGSDCKSCHTEERWSTVTFDHSKTNFNLTGAHTKEDCKACHFKNVVKGVEQQKFAGLSNKCSDCHTDKHFGQFEKGGTTDCTQCHGTENWKASKFNHSNTAFKLDGKHINVPCEKCHKPQQEGSSFYVIYKIKDYRCESCHS